MNSTTPQSTQKSTRDDGEVRAEYEAIRTGVGMIDFPAAGKLEVSGKNAIQFINGLVTNDVKSLEAGDGALAAFLDVHGKVVALCRFYQTGRHLFIELDAANSFILGEQACDTRVS